MNERIRKVGANGIITTVAGNGSQGFWGDNGFTTDASLNEPQEAAVDGSGDLFIADCYQQPYPQGREQRYNYHLGRAMALSYTRAMAGKQLMPV